MKLITKGTIEESILNMSIMKLKLDKKISSEDKNEQDINKSSSTPMETDSNEEEDDDESESNNKSKLIYIFIL